jgi:hypothetical protein
MADSGAVALRFKAAEPVQAFGGGTRCTSGLEDVDAVALTLALAAGNVPVFVRARCVVGLGPRLW